MGLRQRIPRMAPALQTQIGKLHHLRFVAVRPDRAQHDLAVSEDRPHIRQELEVSDAVQQTAIV